MLFYSYNSDNFKFKVFENKGYLKKSRNLEALNIIIKFRHILKIWSKYKSLRNLASETLRKMNIFF